MIKLSVIMFFIFFASNSIAVGLSKPDEDDIESTCRTLLYQVTKEKGSKEKIVVLSATYKLICSENNSERLDVIHKQFSKIDEGLSDSGACLDASGFVSAGTPRGWTHREIERFYKFNESTGGGWDHMEVERYLNLSPYINNLSNSEFLGFKDLVQSGYELEKVKTAIGLMNMQRYQELQPKESLNNSLF